MSATAWKSPSTLVNDSSVGSVSWTSIANLAAADGVNAQPFSGDNFSAPVVSDIKLVVANSIVGTKKSDTNTIVGYDAPTDWRYIPRSNLGTFDQMLSSTQVNNANFGIAIAYGKKDFSTQAVTTTSYYAKLSGFNFGVPSGSTIKGIEIRIKGEYRAYAGPGIEYVYVDAIQVRVIYDPPIVPDQPTLNLRPARGGSYFTWGATPFTFANGYKFRKKITINKNQVNGSNNLSNFEFGFYHVDPDLRSTSNDGAVEYNYGALVDIRFELPDGTKLSHEIERYEPDTGKIAAWIKIPTLYKAVDTEIYIYYGKKLVPDTINGILRGFGYDVNSRFTGKSNWSNAAYNNGEVEIYGANMINPYGVSMTAPAANDNGPELALSENNQASAGIYVGYIMYSQQLLTTRFSGGFNAGYAQNYCAVRWTGTQWQADDNGVWRTFTPVSTDVLVAEAEWNAAGTTNSYRVFAPIRAGEEDNRNTWNANYRSILHFNYPADGTTLVQEHYDSSARGNPASSYGAMSSADLVDGKIGKGVELDGSNDYIQLNVDQASHTLSVNGDLTLSVWIQPFNFSARYDIVGKAYGGEFEITQETNGGVNFYWGTSGGNTGSPNVNPGYQSLSSPANALSTYQWNHIVVSRKLGAGGWLRLYVNGVLVASTTPLYSSASQTALNITLGYGRLTAYWPGIYDEFRILAAAKTTEEIITEYNNQLAVLEYQPELTTNNSWTIGKAQFISSQFLSLSASGDSNADALLRFPQLIGADVSGDSDASARVQFPYLKATVSGDSDAIIGEILINPFYLNAISGDSDATMYVDQSIVGGATVSGDSTATVNIDQYSPDIEKKYYYDVFARDGRFLKSWQDVTTPFKLPEQINTAGAAMKIDLGRNPKDFGENLDVAFGNRVVIRVVDNQLPNGKNVFQGKIVDYEPDFDAKKVSVVLESYGSQFESMLVESGESVAWEYTTIGSQELASPTYDPNWGALHMITTPNSATKLSAIEYRLRAGSAAMVGKAVQIRVTEQGGTEVARAQMQLTSQSFEIYKFQLQNRPTLAQSSVYYVYLEWASPVPNGLFWIGLDNDRSDTTSDIYQYFYNSNTQVGNYHVADGDAYYRLYKTTGSTQATYNSTELSDAIRDILTNYNERGGVITFDEDSIVDTGVVASIKLNSISILDAINEILKHAPAGFYWYIDQGERKFYFKHFETNAEHTFKVGHHVTSLKNAKSIAQIVNVVYFTGKSPLYKKYTRQSSIDKYDESAKPLADGRVELEASADLVANRYLDIFSGPRFDVAFAVADNNVDPRGYDLESVTIGQMIKLGNLNPPSSTQYDIAQYDLATYDYALEDASSLTFQLTSMVREKGILAFTLSNYPSDDDTNRTIQQLKNALNGIRTEDNPDTPDV